MTMGLVILLREVEGDCRLPIHSAGPFDCSAIAPGAGRSCSRTSMTILPREFAGLLAED